MEVHVTVREVPDSIGDKLGAAAEVFAERGFDGTRVEDIAEATGVPKATLYYYFKGKEDILAHLLGSMLEKIRDGVKEAISGGGSPKERLAGVIAAQLAVMASSPATCRALVAELGRAGRIPEIAGALNEAFYAPVRTLLVEGAADGSLRRVSDPEIAAASVFGALTIAGIHEIAVSGTLDADRLATDVLPLLMQGLATPEPSSRRRRR